MVTKNETRYGDLTTTQTNRERIVNEDGSSYTVVNSYSTTTPDVLSYKQYSFNSSSQSGNRKDPTPYSYQKIDYEAGGGTSNSVYIFDSDASTGTISDSASGLGLNGYTAGFDNDNYPEANEAENKAISQLYDSFRGSIDLSIDVAEAGQTSKMLRDAAKLEAKILSISPKRWANRWLQFQYGWRPLASTLYESASRLVEKDWSSLTTVTRTGVDSVSASAVHPHRGKRTRTERCLIKCTYDLSNPDLSVSAARWTSLNPASIAWELMPYSFVVDWFYDIGGSIRSLESSFLYRNQFRRGFKSTTYFESESANLALVDRSPSVVRVYTGSYRQRLVRFSRTLLTSTPVPNLPTFKVDLGSQRLLSAASLLAQHLR